MTVKRPGCLEDEGQNNQADEVLTNTTDRKQENFNKNTTAPQVYIKDNVINIQFLKNSDLVRIYQTDLYKQSFSTEV